MKLLVFCPYYPPHIGGLESHSDEFNKYLSQRGIGVTVFTPRLPLDAPEFETRYNNVKIIRFPAFEIVPNYPLPKFWSVRFWRLFLGLFKENFDIVISRTRFFIISFLALIFSKIKKIKWAHIEHGSDFSKLDSKFKSFAAKFYDYTLGKLTLYFSDVNIANSMASANFCKKLANNKKCEIIYRGVENDTIEKIQPDLKLKELYADKIIIAFIGRLIDGKGVRDLIQAFNAIKDNGALFVIGEGPQRNILEKLVENLKLNERIMFFGQKKFEDAISILKTADICVNPSYTEGLPTSVIEAALCKKAIIATSVGGTPEIITDKKSGFLIEPRNITLLKEKLEILINDKNLREKLGNNAYKEVKNKFNWNNSIEKYLKIFNKI